MNRRLSFALCVLFVMVGRASAQTEVRAIVEKAVKAHGAAEKLAKIKAIQLKNKGTLELLGGLAFTQEVSILQPDRFKDVMKLDVQGKEVTVITVFDGKKAWVSADGKTMELKDKVLEEIKEAMHLMRVMRLLFLKDKTVELSLLGEIKVNDRPAVGVKAVCKGHRDVDLFFDKETGLLAKVLRRAVDPMSDQEYTEERIITEYQEIDGNKTAKKVLVTRDGKKFLEAEVLEVKYPATIDESEFAKP